MNEPCKRDRDFVWRIIASWDYPVCLGGAADHYGKGTINSWIMNGCFPNNTWNHIISLTFYVPEPGQDQTNPQ